MYSHLCKASALNITSNCIRCYKLSSLMEKFSTQISIGLTKVHFSEVVSNKNELFDFQKFQAKVLTVQFYICSPLPSTHSRASRPSRVSSSHTKLLRLVVFIISTTLFESTLVDQLLQVFIKTNYLNTGVHYQFLGKSKFRMEVLVLKALPGATFLEDTNRQIVKLLKPDE